jgi:hypothetical protein
MIQSISDSKNEEGEKNTLEDSVSDLMENTLLQLEKGCEFVDSPGLANIIYGVPATDEYDLLSDEHGSNLDWMPQATFGAPHRSSGENLIAITVTATSKIFFILTGKKRSLYIRRRLPALTLQRR